MRTHVISDEIEFAALRDEWDAVLSASRADGPFLRHGWLSDWWRAFGVGELQVVTCRDDTSGELLGVLPVYRCRVGTVVPSRVVRLLGDGKGGSTGLGIFALPRAETEVWEAAHRALIADIGPWDALELHRLRDGDPFAEYIAGAMGGSDAAPCVCATSSTLVRPLVALPATWDEYLATSLSHDGRRNVRRCIRRAEAMGARVETVLDPDELVAAVDEAITLHEDRMRHIVSPGYTLNSARRTFVHSSCKTLLAESRLRLAFLVIDGQRVACKCQMRYGDTCYALWTGFLGEWGHAEVAKTLLSQSLRRAIAEGCTMLDFGLGEQSYKFEWGVTSVDRFGSFTAYAPGARGRLARGQDACVTLAQRALDGAPDGLREPLWRLAQGARRLVQPR